MPMTLLEENTMFNHELGWALGQWAWVEYAMFEVLSTCVQPDQVSALGKGLFSIENNRSKLAFVDAIMDSACSQKPQSGEWASLHKRLSRLAVKRNELAHQVLNIIPTLPAGRRIALEPWVFKPSKFKNRTPQHPPGSICIRDVAEIGLQFYALRCALTNFAARLAGKKEPQPKDHEQLAGQPTLQQIRDRIHAGLQPPPEP